MKEKLLHIEISGYDSSGPETADNIASISFKDLNNADGAYCVGFKFKDVDLRNPDNWEYGHTNYWTPEILEDDSIEKNPISREKVIEILGLHGQSVSSLIEIYCGLLSQS